MIKFVGLLWIIGIVGCIGWWFNIYHIITMHSTESAVDLAIQIVGVFAAPLGAILGWIQ